MSLGKWIACLFILLGGSPLLYGQRTTIAPSSPIPVAGSDENPNSYQRVFIPRSELSSLLPKDFLPVKISELEQLLASDPNSQSGSTRQLEPYLAQVILIASLNGEDLVSDVSRFVIQHDDEVRAGIDVHPLSMAIRPVTLGLLNEKQQESFMRMAFSKDGTPRWIVDETTSVWFGWTQRPSGDRDRRGRLLDFELALPRSIDSKLLLRLPPLWKVDSEQSAVQRCASLSKSLPSDWPTTSLSLLRESDNWWEVSFSGLSQLKLRLSRQEEQRNQAFLSVLTSQETNYSISGEGLSLSTNWTMHESTDTNRPIRIKLDPRLRIRDLTLEGRSVPWEQTGEWLTAETSAIPGGLGDAGGRWSLRAAMPWENQFASSTTESEIPRSANESKGHSNPLNTDPYLPTVQIEGAFVLSGTTRVEISRYLKPRRIWSKKGAFLSSERNEAKDRTWTSRWNGIPDEWIVETEAMKLPWSARTLTLVKPRGDSTIAITTVQLETGENPASLVSVAIGSGWNFESVNSLDARVAVVPTSVQSDEHGTRMELILSPAVTNQSVQLEFQMRHSAASASQDRRILPTSRVLTFANSKQSDVYVVESGSEFSLRPTAALLNSRIQEKDLEAWQKAKLPRFAETWILNAREELPALEFEPQPASFSAEHNTSVKSYGDQVELRYRIRCTPFSGSIQRISLRFHAAVPEPLRWRLVDKNGESGFSEVTPLPIESGQSANTVELRFDKSIAESFELVGICSFELRDQSPIPILTIPEAYRQVSTMEVDRNLKFELQDQDVNFLPSAIPTTQDNVDSIDFAYDASRNLQLSVAKRPTSHVPGWVLSESIQDIVLPSGQLRHSVSFKIESWGQRPVLCRIPSEWRCERCLVEGIETNFRVDRQKQLLQVELQRGSQARQGSLVMEFSDETILTKESPLLNLKSIELVGYTGLVARHIWIPANWKVENSNVPGWATWYLRFLPWTWHQGLFSEEWGSLFHSTPERVSTSLIELDSRWRKQSSSWNRLVLNSTISTGSNSLAIDPPSDTENRALNMPIQPQEESVRFVSRRNDQAFCWCFLLGAFGLSLHLQSKKLRTGRSLLFIPLLLLFWVSEDWIGVVHSSLVGVVVALAADLLLGVVRNKSVNDHHSTVASNPFSQPISSMTLFWALVSGSMLLPGGSAFGQLPQVPKSTVASPSKGANGTEYKLGDKQLDRDRTKRPHAIVFPIDSSGNLDGSIAYIPSDFYRKLTRTESDENRNSPQLLTARYQFSLSGNGLTSGMKRNDEFVMVFDVDVPEKSEWFRIPLAISQSRFTRFTVDDVEVPLGARLRWDDDEIAWLPEREGKLRLKLYLHLIEQRPESDHHQVHVNIIPMATALLEVQAPLEVATEVQIASQGQVLNPAIGRYAVQLGPLPFVDVQWRNPIRKVETKEPSRSVSETWVDLSRNRPLAMTQVKIANWPTDSESIEIEGPADWQPLGSVWGDAKLVSIASNSLARRRFRLSWMPSETNPPDPNSREIPRGIRNIEILWTIDSETVSLLSVPTIDVIGNHVDQRFVTFGDPVSPYWKLEGSSVWNSVPFRPGASVSGSEAVELGQSYQIPDNVSPAVIRRVSQNKSTPARSSTVVRFLPDKILLKTSTSWATAALPVGEIEYAVPNEFVANSVKVNGQETLFSEREKPSGKVVACFIAKETGSVQSIELEGIFPVVALVNQTKPVMTRIPVARLLGFDEIEHRITGLCSADAAVEFQSLDSWPTISTSGGSDGLATKPGEYWLWSRRLPSSLWAALNDEVAWPAFHVATPASIEGKMLTLLSQSEGGWFLRIEGVLKDTNRHVLNLDLPTAAIEPLHLENANRIQNVSSASRTFVEIPVEEGMFRLEGEFPMELTQALGMLDVRLIDGEEVNQFLGVPNIVNGQARTIDVSGAAIVTTERAEKELSEWAMHYGDLGSVYIRTGDRVQVRIDTGEDSEIAMRCRNARFELDVDESRSWSLTCQYWLEPLSQNRIRLIVPKLHSLARVSVHGRDLDYKASSGAWILDLNPTDIPFILEVVVRGTKEGLESIRAGELPRIEGLNPQKEFWQVRLLSDQLRLEGSTHLPTISSMEWYQAEWDVVHDLVSLASQTILSRDSKYRQGWYGPWRRLQRHIIVDMASEMSKKDEDSFAEPKSIATTEGNQSGLKAWMERWGKALQQSDALDVKFGYLAAETRVPLESVLNIHSLSRIRTYHWIDEMKGPRRNWRLAPVSNSVEMMWVRGVATIAGLFLTGGLFAFSGKWGQWFSILQQRPWWIVTIAGCLLMIVLPGLLIGAVVGLLAVASVIHAYVIEWQRTRRLRRA